MKLTLGMIVKNEERFLELILPSMKDCFDEIVAVDAESTDRTVQILKDLGAKVKIRKWNYDYAAARNEVIRMATGDWMLQLDADEAMFVEDLQKLRGHLTPDKLGFVLPRISFVTDFEHWEPRFYPDYQARGFQLGKGFHYRHKLHETLYRGDETQSAYAAGHLMSLDPYPIYHYGMSRPVQDWWRKIYVYDCIQKGVTPEAEVPEDSPRPPLPLGHVFAKDHPLKGKKY